MGFFTKSLLGAVTACDGGLKTVFTTAFLAKIAGVGSSKCLRPAGAVGGEQAAALQNIEPGIRRARVNAHLRGHACEVAYRAVLADGTQQILLTLGNVPHVNILFGLRVVTYGVETKTPPTWWR